MNDDIYKPPKANADVEGSEPGLSVTVSILSFFLSLFVVFFLLFGFAGEIKDILENVGVIRSLTERIVVDAILSMVFLIGYFCLMLMWRQRHGLFINAGIASFFFVYWYFESGFHWFGFSTDFPVWYEVNMAFNEVFAAIVSYFLMRKRLVKIRETKQENTENDG